MEDLVGPRVQLDLLLGGLGRVGDELMHVGPGIAPAAHHRQHHGMRDTHARVQLLGRLLDEVLEGLLVPADEALGRLLLLYATLLLRVVAGFQQGLVVLDLVLGGERHHHALGVEARPSRTAYDLVELARAQAAHLGAVELGELGEHHRVDGHVDAHAEGIGAADDRQQPLLGQTFHEHGKDPELWNIACDASINGNLKKDGLELVEGMIERDDALLFSEEELYEIIKDEEKNNNNKKRPQPHVSHDSWDNNQNNSSKTDSSKTIDANSFFEKARQDRIENLKKLKENLVKQALETNPNKDYKNNSINNIDGATRLVDWRRLLENNCRIDKDWTYQNATIEYGVLTPHMEDLPRPTIEILLDTSGSINTQLLRNFLKECLGILTYSKIKVGCFDDDFYGFQEVRNKNDIENFPLKGGGGTNFDIAVKAFSKDADNKIIFTDGLADMPNVSAKIIWVVFGKDKINPLGGKVIYINENQYEDLNKNTSVIRR